MPSKSERSGKFDVFWIVWSPTGTTPPRKRHQSRDAARAEAERLAFEAPNAEFFVLEADSRAKKATVDWSFSSDEDIPF